MTTYNQNLSMHSAEDALIRLNKSNFEITKQLELINIKIEHIDYLLSEIVSSVKVSGFEQSVSSILLITGFVFLLLSSYLWLANLIRTVIYPNYVLYKRNETIIISSPYYNVTKSVLLFVYSIFRPLIPVPYFSPFIVELILKPNVIYVRQLHGLAYVGSIDGASRSITNLLYSFFYCKMKYGSIELPTCNIIKDPTYRMHHKLVTFRELYYLYFESRTPS